MQRDFREHFELLLSLLSIERKEDRKQYLDKIRNRSIEDRRKDGVCWYPVTVSRSTLGLGEKWVLELERTSHLGESHLFQAGTSAAVFVNHEGKHPSVSGVISGIREDRIRIMLNAEEPPDWIDDGKLGLDLLFDESTYDEMEKISHRLSETTQGRLYDLIALSLGHGNPRFERVQDISFPLLNDSQNAAVNVVRSALDLALIHGPPGTGKTTTLIHCITEALDHEKQVLVCAPSNTAVDLLVEKLHEREINVVRLGHPARVTDAVISQTLDSQLSTHGDARTLKGLRRKSEEMIRHAKKYKRKYGREEARQRSRLFAEAKKLKHEARLLEDYMIQSILSKASVIACTLIGATHSLLRDHHFKTVFIDEASQGLEPACWAPILKGDRVVMAGDHLQLPPTIKSPEVSKSIMAQTLFERCIGFHDEAGTMLLVQYRMHPDIMAFSNIKFYDGRLTTSEGVLRRKEIFDQPIEFIDTAGGGFTEQVNPETLSTFNKEEAEFTMKHLHDVLSSSGEVFTVGVIAPYKAQVESLKRSFFGLKWDENVKKSISINTVDAFQGQERDIIFISLTRSNDSGEIGFLSNQRRMNVAMTRARYKLVIIGDSATLSHNGFYDEMIVHCQKNGTYHSIFEY